jgi:hypothetical protein
VRLPQDAPVYRGERVLLAVEAADVLVFDAAGERNLLL